MAAFTGAALRSSPYAKKRKERKRYDASALGSEK
jgi:hypothetical protein